VEELKPRDFHANKIVFHPLYFTASLFMRGLFLVLLLYVFVVEGQDTSDITSVRFKTFTRGASKTITISRDSIAISPDGRAGKQPVRCKIKKEDWNLLIKQLNQLNVTDIPSLNSPTNKRAVDGAWHSEIVVQTTAQKSYSHSFDNEEPDEKLKSLMQVIAMLEKKYSGTDK
jgi:hypothetical protein